MAWSKRTGRELQLRLASLKLGLPQLRGCSVGLRKISVADNEKSAVPHVLALFQAEKAPVLSKDSQWAKRALAMSKAFDDRTKPELQ
ncbi:hypothetical protein V7S43_016654 [Phytophthora oleae]|uniref:Uncharacterized protein n=1 Tax=Phytophthora oleae TaxID=2107226 RepID=A0ABD3EWC8_9STRA